MSEEVIGRKDDGHKDRWDLLPIDVIQLIVKVLTFGARKYADNNWMKIDNGTERYYAALQRHLAEWRLGAEKDEESGIHHLGHALCCLVFMTWFELNRSKTN